MASRDDFLRVIGMIYEATLQPDGWPAALSQAGKLLNSKWLVMAAARITGEIDLVTQDQDGSQDHLDLFRRKYINPDTNPAVPVLLARRPGFVVLREENVSDADWHHCGLYQEIYRPVGIYHGLGAYVLKTDTHSILLGVNRAKRCGAFTQRDLVLVREMLPHLQQAMRTFLRLADLQSHKTAYEELWNKLTHGVILLDELGKVLWANRMATDLIKRGDGFSLRSGSLCAANPQDNNKLSQCVRAALAARAGKGSRVSGVFSVSRPSQARSFAVSISPLCKGIPFVHAPAAIVFVDDPKSKCEATPDVLRALYGLTVREATLAALLLQGFDLRESAEQLAVSMNTVRTYLRLIFEKTGTHRQAELVRHLQRGPAGLLSN